MIQKSKSERLLWAQFDALEMGSGWDDTDILKPQIIIEDVYGDSHPGSVHLNQLAEQIHSLHWEPKVRGPGLRVSEMTFVRSRGANILQVWTPPDTSFLTASLSSALLQPQEGTQSLGEGAFLPD